LTVTLGLFEGQCRIGQSSRWQAEKISLLRWRVL